MTHIYVEIVAVVNVRIEEVSRGHTAEGEWMKKPAHCKEIYRGDREPHVGLASVEQGVRQRGLIHHQASVDRQNDGRSGLGEPEC